jgi:hypothetical protein
VRLLELGRPEEAPLRVADRAVDGTKPQLEKNDPLRVSCATYLLVLN